MSRLKAMVRRFDRNVDGATMPEYALMVALIAIVCILAVTAIGANANGIFNQIAAGIGAA